MRKEEGEGYTGLVGVNIDMSSEGETPFSVNGNFT
jgi:hypothetical protein